jgi:tetratricopeptide (TPR) repeat protein
MRLNQRCTDAALTTGREIWMGAALTGLAAFEWFMTDPRTLDHANEALAKLERSGSPTWLATALLQVARARMLMGDSSVGPLLERAVDVASGFAYVLPVPYAHAHLGEIYLENGDYARGLEHFREAIVGLYRARDVSDLGVCLGRLAGALVPHGRFADAVLVYEGVKHLAPNWLAVPINTPWVSLLDDAEASLPASQRDELVEAAKRLHLDALVDLALALCDDG